MNCLARTWFVKTMAAALALCALATGSASAQSAPPTQYTVSGVAVDVTSQNATQARNEAFAKAPALAFERLVKRLALDTSAVLPAADQLTLDQMVASITVEEERRSGTRYFGRLAVTFRGEPVRAYFANAGVRIVDQRGQALLIVPLMPTGPTQAQASWRTAWANGGYGQEVRPLAVAPATLTGGPDWTQAASAAAGAASPTAVYAVATLTGATLTADLTEVGPQGFRRERGRVTAQVRAGEGGLDDGLRRLAEAANGLLQAEYKAMVATGSAPRSQRITVSALYSGLAEWTRIKRGLDAAEDAIVRDVRIEAINRNGSLVSFTTLGDMEQLTTELQRTGIVLENAPGGAILRAPGSR